MMGNITTNTPAMVESYHRLGWYLVPIPSGSKGPKTKGWQQKHACIAPGQPFPSGMSVGIAHAYSGTVSLDIDDITAASEWLQTTHSIDLSTYLMSRDMVQITSGVEGHAKLLFRMPPSHLTLPCYTYTKDKQHALQFRNATRQGTTTMCVLPFSIHPGTQKPYEWIGDYRNVPVLPDELLQVWLKGLGTSESITHKGDVDTSEAEIESALASIDPDEHRDTWVKIGMAIHAADPDLYHVFESWSSNGLKFVGAHDCESVWSSFNSDTPSGVTVLSLFKRAREAGWHGFRRPADDVFKPILPQSNTMFDTYIAAAPEVTPPVEAPAPVLVPEAPIPTYWDSIRASQYLDIVPEPINVLVPDMVPMEGVTGLVAPAGHGKSNLMVQLGWAMTTQSCLFNDPSRPVRQGACYIVEAEDRVTSFHRRLHRLRTLYPEQAERYGQQGHEMYFHNPAGKDIRLTDRYGNATPFVDDLIAQIATAPTRIECLMVGPLINLSGGTENNEDTQAVLRELDRISLACGCAVLVPHHVSKTAALATDRSEHAARGGSSFTGSVRAQIHIQNMGTDEAEKLGISDKDRLQWVGVNLSKGNDLPPSREITWLKRDPGGASMTWTEEQPRRRKTDTVKPMDYREVLAMARAIMDGEQTDWTVHAFSKEYGGKAGKFGVGHNALREMLMRAALDNAIANRMGPSGRGGPEVRYLLHGKQTGPTASDVFEKAISASPDYLK